MQELRGFRSSFHLIRAGSGAVESFAVSPKTGVTLGHVERNGAARADLGDGARGAHFIRVLRDVFGARQKLKITKPVVRLVLVDVVDRQPCRHANACDCLVNILRPTDRRSPFGRNETRHIAP